MGFFENLIGKGKKKPADPSERIIGRKNATRNVAAPLIVFFAGANIMSDGIGNVKTAG